MKETDLERFFKLFLAGARPPVTGEKQIQTMKIAFYAGAGCLYALMIEKIDSEPENSDGGEFLANLESEIAEFIIKNFMGLPSEETV